MASDAKVTVEEMLADLEIAIRLANYADEKANRYYSDGLIYCYSDGLIAATAYIRRANAVLGPECACGHFKVEHMRDGHPRDNWCLAQPCKCVAYQLVTGATESERREG